MPPMRRRYPANHDIPRCRRPRFDLETQTLPLQTNILRSKEASRSEHRAELWIQYWTFRGAYPRAALAGNPGTVTATAVGEVRSRTGVLAHATLVS